MARIMITGSADGLGQMAARLLIGGGHEVVLHARNDQRASDALEGAPGAAGVITGDLAVIDEMAKVAAQAEAAGPFDAVIHNAGVGHRQQARRVPTRDGLSSTFAINVLAPYLLTALIPRPRRLIYLSSGLHRGGDPGLGRPAMGTAPVERFPGLRGFQALRRGAGVRRRPLVARCLFQCRGTRLGGHQNGRPGSVRRPVAGAGHAGVARRERGSRSHCHQRALLSPAPA